MVQCAATNCTVKSGKGISMYLFPKNPKLRKEWTIKLKREGFQPSQYTKICERHFEKNQFSIHPDIAAAVGFQAKLKMLITDAIPTIFDYTDPQNNNGKRTKKSPSFRKSAVIEKRRRIETLEKLLKSEDNHSTDTDTQDESSNQFESSTEVQTVDVVTSTNNKECYEKMVQTSYDLVKRRHAKVQTNIELPVSTAIKLVNKGTQTEERNDNSLDTSFTITDNSRDDPDWIPDEDFSEPEQNEENPAKERKFLVFESCLDNLFRKCTSCGCVCEISKFVIGTFVKINSLCKNCCVQKHWESQPTSNTMPLGNLIVAGAILFSGGSVSNFINISSHASIQMFSISTFMNIQKLYLVPTVKDVWESSQARNFDDARSTGEPLRLGGDGRCCSPGHTAKYLSYTLMDLKTNKILDTQLIQKNEVKNSYAMELEGLKRSLDRIIVEENLQISHLVTDRHSQIKKYMRETHTNITHWFDCWHVAKGIFKKLEALGKRNNCKIIGQWSRSISNHIYWCAMSSNGDGELVYEKWMSILNHVCNVHEGHGMRFPKCEHEAIEDRIWFKRGSKAYDGLEKIIKGRLLVTDIKKISPAEQTSGLEAFHNVLCHFSPKLVHFFHAQMEARLQIAALHFNENANRKQAVNQHGELIYAVSFPKSRKGEGVAKEVKVKQTFDYVDELFEELVLRREINSSFAEAKRRNEIEGKERPLPISKEGSHADKCDIVAAHRSRFN